MKFDEWRTSFERGGLWRDSKERELIEIEI